MADEVSTSHRPFSAFTSRSATWMSASILIRFLSRLSWRSLSLVDLVGAQSDVLFMLQEVADQVPGAPVHHHFHHRGLPMPCWPFS
jgi:hypothetical protein